MLDVGLKLEVLALFGSALDKNYTVDTNGKSCRTPATKTKV